MAWASRAAVSNARHACADDGGNIYVSSSAGGTFRVSPDWLTVSVLSATGVSTSGKIAVSPDGTKIVLANGEQVYRIE